MLVKEKYRLYWFYLDFPLQELLNMGNFGVGWELVLEDFLVVEDEHLDRRLSIWLLVVHGRLCVCLFLSLQSIYYV